MLTSSSTPCSNMIIGNTPDKGKKRVLEEDQQASFSFDVDAKEDERGKETTSKVKTDQSLLNRLAGPSSGKAGLLRDPQEVANIIYEASKGSPYFENEKKRNEQLEKQIDATLSLLQKEIFLRNGDLSREESVFEKMCESIESTRVLDQTVVVVDADAFFASVEELRNPSIKGKAFGVGRSVLSTASYEARRYGARSGMAGHIAKKLCPHLIFVKAHYDEYKRYSDLIFGILRCYDPDLSPASLDEAYMNITNYLSQNPHLTPSQAVQEMRDRVKSETGLTVSAGVAPNKMLAKIAADVNKPNGQCVIEPSKESCMEFIHDLSVRKVPGIGRVKEQWLSSLGIKQVKDIWPHRAQLYLVESAIGLDHLIHAYLGIGESVVQIWGREDRQSIGSEATFHPLSDISQIYEKMDEISKSLADDIEKLNYIGRTITLKLKLDTFQLITRSKTRGSNLYYDGCAETLFNVGKELFDKERSLRHDAYDIGGTENVVGCRGSREFHIRLLGLKLSNLRDETESKSKTKTSLDLWMQNNSSSNKEEEEDDESSSVTIRNDLDEDDIEKDIEHQLSQTSPNSSMIARSNKDYNRKEEEEGEDVGEILSIEEGESNNIVNQEHRKQKHQLVCPVCGKVTSEITATETTTDNDSNCKENEENLIKFNQHLDECLFLQQYATISRKKQEGDDGEREKNGHDAFQMMMRSSTGNKTKSSNTTKKKKKK